MLWPAILFILKKVQINIICPNFKGSVYFYSRKVKVQILNVGNSGQQQLWTETDKEKAYLPNPESDNEKTLEPNLQ